MSSLHVIMVSTTHSDGKSKKKNRKQKKNKDLGLVKTT